MALPLVAGSRTSSMGVPIMNRPEPATTVADLLRCLMLCSYCPCITHYPEDLPLYGELVCENCGETIRLEPDLKLESNCS